MSPRDPARRSRFRRAVVPMALVLPLALAALLYVEFSMPQEGVAARAAYAEEHDVALWRTTWIVAASLASLPLVAALVRDRDLVAAGTDREQSHYLGAGIVLVLVGTFLGAVPAALVGCGLVAGAAWARRAADGDPVARDLRTAAWVAMAGLLVLMVARQSFHVFATWRYGFGVSPETSAAYAADHRAQLVTAAAYVVATLAALVPLLVQLRHRRALSSAPGLAVGVGAAVVVLALLAQALPLAALGLLEIALGLLWARRPGRS